MTEIQARFITDEDGVPVFIERHGLRHYKIEVSTHTNERVGAVLYRLHPSYRDPVRESFDAKDGFRIRITSYGDFEVRAEVETKKGRTPLRSKLSAALEKQYKDNRSDEIFEALVRIRKH